MSLSAFAPRPRCFTSPVQRRRLSGPVRPGVVDDGAACVRVLAPPAALRPSAKAQHYSSLSRSPSFHPHLGSMHSRPRLRSLNLNTPEQKTLGETLPSSASASQSLATQAASAIKHQLSLRAPARPADAARTRAPAALSIPMPALTRGSAPRTPSSPRCASPHLPPESPIAHARRAPPSEAVPPLQIRASASAYRLAIPLPRPGGRAFAPEMITLSAKRGDRLAVVADAWHLERDCHYEWQIAFPPQSVDMLSVRARVDDAGCLAIEVRRNRARPW